MPRRRHDSDTEDSDGSDLDSPEPRRQKPNKSTRRPGRADSNSSEDRFRSKSSKSKRKESLSETDPSPVKKSIASKIEKTKDRERSKKGSKGNKRQLNEADSSPDKKRARGRQFSPSDRGQQSVGKTFKRGNKQDRESNQRDSMRFQRSPDRNPKKRHEDQTLGQFLESPPRRGKGSGEFDPRGFDERDRGYGNRNEPRQRSFDRPIDRRNFSGSERENLRSRSPQERWNRGRKDSWRDEDLQMDGRLRRSPSPNFRRGRNRSLSPVRRNSGMLSPAGTRRQFPNRERSISVENNKSLGQKRGKKSGRKKGTNSEMLASDSDMQSPNEPSMPIKNKGSRKRRDDSVERSFARSKMSLSEENLHSGNLDDIDRSFESLKKSKKTKGKRRKSTSDSESVSPDRSKRSDKTSKSGTKVREKISKKGKKSKAAKNDIDKETRSLSRSVERTISEGSMTSKNKKKQSNSAKQRSLSKSPSPHNDSMRSEPNRSRSSEFNRSTELNRSTEVIIGRNHDMTKFESEPESGEITDSEEEGEKASRQAVKSQIKKPTEEELQKLEDEKYWEEKRKASRRAEDQSFKGEERRNKDRGSKRRQEEMKEPQPTIEPSSPAPKKPKTQDGGVAALTGRTGGAYIPPARLRAMQAKITDKSSVEYQRISWEALKKSINGLVNKVNVSNIEMIVRELFEENIVRGRGLMARSIIQAQAASPTFTHVYAALVAIVNTKFPQNGELVLKRLVQQFRRSYKRNDKSMCLSSTRFIAHLVNQQVAHEVLSLEILTLLLEEPTDDSVEVAIGFLKECGAKLTDVSPRGINAIFERLRNVLHEGQIDKRVQYMMEVMFAVRKDGFKDNKAVLEDLDLVEEDDQFTHLMTLDDVTDGEELLNVFRADPDYLESEEKYKVLKKEILGDESSDEEEDGSGSGSSSSEDDSDNEEDAENKQTIVDSTETNMVALRRTIYLTIQSSLDFEECAHKLMKMDLKPGQEVELCNMILDCCGQMRTYEKFFGLLAGRFCMIDKKYVEPFQQMFMEQYSTIHRLETNKLRNVAKFFAHLLHTDSLSWAVLSCIKLNEDDTTSASRIFIKILFQELSEFLGLPKLNERLKDPTLQEYFTGLMPRDNPRDTRFAINFFTTIGLGGLTDDLRDHLKSVSKKLMEQKQEQQAQEGSDSDSSDSMSSDSSDSSSDEDSSQSASSDSESSEDDRRKKKKVNAEKKKEAEKKKKKEKSRIEPQITKGKRDKRDKDKSNGAIEKADRRKEKKSKRGKQSAEDPKQLDEQFRRLAKLANYGNDVILPVDTDRRERQKRSQDMDDRRDRRGNREIRSPERDPFEAEGRRRELVRDMYDPRDRLSDPRDRGGYERRAPIDRGYDGFGGRDDREPRRGRKGRDFIDDDRDNRPVQIERNFARLDVYENKFEREREMNLEYLRNQGEFEDYFRGRNDLGRDSFERGDFRGPRGRAEEWDDRRMGPPYGERDVGRGMVEGRRRNRSEERVPVMREERRRRR